jgi:hypothetical protein
MDTIFIFVAVVLATFVLIVFPIWKDDDDNNWDQ